MQTATQRKKGWWKVWLLLGAFAVMSIAVGCGDDDDAGGDSTGGGTTPAATQAAVAQVQPAARVMMEALSMEGLRYGHHVTIDEAGPVFEARIDNLQAVLGAHRRIVAFDADAMPTTAANWLIAMGDMPRVVVARAHALGRTLHLAPAVRDSLGLADGDAVWTVPMADALA